MPSIIADLYADDKMRNKYGDVTKYSMPMHDTIDPKYKDTKEYCMEVTKAGFSSLLRDRTALPGSAYRYMQALRNYGSGNQPEEFYINLFNRDTSSTNSSSSTVPSDTDGVWTNSKESNKTGLGNISTKIVSPVTNLKSALHGILDQEASVFVNSIDSGSIEVEERKMYEALFDAENAGFLQGMREQHGVNLQTKSIFPDDVELEELQVYKEMGGFRTEWSIAIEQLLKHTLKKSEYKQNVKRKWVDDVLDLNLIAARSVYDPETCEERLEYMDPENVTAQYSMEQNFDDSEYMGYFKLEKLSKLVQRGFSKEQLVDVARRYEYYFGNHKGINWNDATGSEFFDNNLQAYNIPVYHFYWIDTDVSRKLKTKNKYRTVINDVDFDAEIKPVSDYRKKQGVEQEEMRTRVRKVRQCSWIVDTDLAYDCGLVPNQTRKDRKKTPIMPLHLWRGITTNKEMVFGSIIESIIPFLDNLQMAWLKYQDSLIRATPSGYMINIRLLQNLEIGGKKISPIDAFELFYKTGKMPYADVALGSTYAGGAVLPMTKIDGNLGELMTVISTEIHFNLAMIEKLTGVSSSPLGQQADPNQPVTSVQMAAQGTNNVIRPFLDAMWDMKERLCDYAARRIQLLIRNNEQSRKAYSLVIGEKSVDMLRQMERLGAEYGMYTEVRPEQAEIQQLIVAAEEAIAPGRDGKVQIDLSQYMYIIEQINSGGNLKKLTRDLSFMIRRNDKKQQAIAEQNIRAQAEQQAQMKQQEAQMDMQKQQGETQGNIVQDNNKAKNEEKQMQIQANIDYEKMLLQTKLDLMKDAAAKQQQQPAKIAG